MAATPKPVTPPKTREASLSDLQGDVDAWFSSQGVDVSSFGSNPDDMVADDPEGNEISSDPKSLGNIAAPELDFAAEEDFATRIRGMMRESYNRSYKEATKKLI